jgi:hypothetical protein
MCPIAVEYKKLFFLQLKKAIQAAAAGQKVLICLAAVE